MLCKIGGKKCIEERSLIIHPNGCWVTENHLSIIDNNFQKEEKVNKNKNQGLKMILKSPLKNKFLHG